MISTAWAKDFARHRIRVAAIARGFYRAMVGAMPDKVLDKPRDQIPAGRLPLDGVAHSVQFLFENDYVNGRNLELDSGLHL